MRGRAFAVAAMATVLVSVGATDRAAAMDETVVVPPRPLPVPKTVSPELQRLIGSPMNPSWDQHPASAEAWRALVKTYAADIETALPALMAREKVTIRADRMNGVPVF
ncbi:MAG: alpha/beta hydrolase, partial [Sphingomonas sp.]|nr:alpha/beta hydrolase [Sphingomonas sp.]